MGEFAVSINILGQSDATKILQRLDDMEKKLTSLTSTTNRQSSTSQAVSRSVSITEVKPAPTANVEMTAAEPQAVSVSRSWADQAADLAQAQPTMSFNTVRKKVRVCGKAMDTGSNVKAVPRLLTCFAGRLDASVTAEDLTAFLKDKGVADAKCVKLVPKNGQVFRTSAFRVSCSAVYESVFYDESSWPVGAELRDWIFYNRNGQ